MSEAEKLIETLSQEVDGENGVDENITIFTLSTCMWCKKCKRFLNEKNMKYRYIDVDNIDYKDKSTLLAYLRENYESRISYPFLICESGHVVGYDTDKYDDLLNGGA